VLGSQRLIGIVLLGRMFWPYCEHVFTTGDSVSPLDVAIVHRSLPVVRLLVEAGADLEARGAVGVSAPAYATGLAHHYPDCVEIARLLRLAAGRDFVVD
jgi:hypothetical protein